MMAEQEKLFAAMDIHAGRHWRLDYMDQADHGDLMRGMATQGDIDRRIFRRMASVISAAIEAGLVDLPRSPIQPD